MTWEFLISFLGKEQLSGYIGHLMDALSWDSSFHIILTLSSITCHSHIFFPTEVSIALSRPTFLAPELWNFLATLASVSENGKYSTGLGMGLRIPRFWLQPGFCGGERSKGGEIIFGFQPSLLPYPLLPAQVLSEFRTLIAPQKAPPKMIYSLQPFPGEHPE